MAKLIAIQKLYNHVGSKFVEVSEDEPYIVEDDYNLSDSIMWDEADKCYLKNDNTIERTDEQFLIAKDNTLEGL